jgi:hypothetical protein
MRSSTVAKGLEPAEKLFDLGRDEEARGVKLSLGSGWGTGPGIRVGDPPAKEVVGRDAEAVTLRLTLFTCGTCDR